MNRFCEWDSVCFHPPRPRPRARQRATVGTCSIAQQDFDQCDMTPGNSKEKWCAETAAMRALRALRAMRALHWCLMIEEELCNFRMIVFACQMQRCPLIKAHFDGRLG